MCHRGGRLTSTCTPHGVHVEYSDGMILTTNDLNESDVSEVEPIGFSSFCFFVFFLAESDRKQNKVWF